VEKEQSIIGCEMLFLADSDIGENPYPIYYKDNLPQPLELKHLPLSLPEVEKYLPTPEGAPPLGNAETWAWDTQKEKL